MTRLCTSPGGSIYERLDDATGEIPLALWQALTAESPPTATRIVAVLTESSSMQSATVQRALQLCRLRGGDAFVSIVVLVAAELAKWSALPKGQGLGIMGAIAQRRTERSNACVTASLASVASLTATAEAQTAAVTVQPWLPGVAPDFAARNMCTTLLEALRQPVGKCTPTKYSIPILMLECGGVSPECALLERALRKSSRDGSFDLHTVDACVGGGDTVVDAAEPASSSSWLVAATQTGSSVAGADRKFHTGPAEPQPMARFHDTTGQLPSTLAEGQRRARVRNCAAASTQSAYGSSSPPSTAAASTASSPSSSTAATAAAALPLAETEALLASLAAALEAPAAAAATAFLRPPVPSMHALWSGTTGDAPWDTAHRALGAGPLLYAALMTDLPRYTLQVVAWTGGRGLPAPAVLRLLSDLLCRVDVGFADGSPPLTDAELLWTAVLAAREEHASATPADKLALVQYDRDA